MISNPEAIKIIRHYGENFLNFYLETDLITITKYTYFIEEQSYCGNRTNLSKAIIFDCDGVLDEKVEGVDQSLFANFLNQISIFPKIGRRIPDLVDCIKQIIHERNFYKSLKRFTKILSQCDFTIEQYKEASTEAANEVILTTNAIPLISDLYEMGYYVSIVSGSPSYAIQKLASKRLYIPKNGAFGTIFEFDRQKKIRDTIRHNLGMNKVENKNRYLREKRCPKGGTVVVDDDPAFDFELGGSMGLGLGLWTKAETGFKQKYEQRRKQGDPYIDYVNVSLECPEAREDLRKLIPYIQRWERGKVECFIRSPFSERKLISETQLLEKITKDYIEYGKEQTLQLFETKTKEIISILDPIIDFSVINGLLLELRGGEKNIKLVRDIYSRMEESIPQFKATKEYIQGVDMTIKEWNENFPGVDWW